MSVRGVAFDEPDLTRLLDDLEQGASAVGTTVGDNGETLFRYRTKSLRLDIPRQDAEPVTRIVQPRLIGATSMLLLAPCGLYPQTPCTVYPITPDGGWQIVPARVATCHQLERCPNLWDVRLQFLTRVDVVRFAPSAWRAKILVVDDSPTICQIMARFLPNHHADVTCIQDGRAAIAAAMAERFDLIILDIEMPSVTGIEVVRKLRESGYLFPIVIMTATPPSETRFASMDAGCDMYVSKPIKVSELTELIRFAKPTPVVSDLDDDPASAELVNSYVRALQDIASNLVLAYQSDDRTVLQQLANKLCAEAPTCGFAPLATLAERVRSAVQYGFPRADIRRPLCELIQHLHAARPASSYDIPTPPATSCPLPGSASSSAR